MIITLHIIPRFHQQVLVMFLECRGVEKKAEKEREVPNMFMSAEREVNVGTGRSSCGSYLNSVSLPVADPDHSQRAK